jgi:hypothetical protein
MIEAIEKYFNTKVPLTPAQIERIILSGQLVVLKREEILENRNFQYYSLVLEGCLRCYRLNVPGGEQTLRFLPAYTWHSIQLGLPPTEPPDILTDAVVLTKVMRWTAEAVRQLGDEIPALNELFRRVILENFSEMENRLFITTNGDAEQRYADFVEAYPQILKWAPLHQIASYLGIARETLSRIRNDRYPTAGNLDQD